MHNAPDDEEGGPDGSVPRHFEVNVVQSGQHSEEQTKVGRDEQQQVQPIVVGV